MSHRAIGITRVSQEGDREHIHSYATQAAAIKNDCDGRKGVELLYIGRERDVSGGADLENRPELSRAVEAVEAGGADIIVAAYFERFFRSLEVQSEVIRRVERAGGEVFTLDHGRLTNGTAAQRLQANIVGAMAQFFREQTTEKSAAGQAAAVARGATPWSRVPLGYRRENGCLFVDEATKPIVEQAFEMRAGGASVMKIRAMLKSHGVERSYRGVQVMLASRVYLGEIHFGKLVNLDAHEPIIDRELWSRVQRMVIPRGRRPSSDRLLARLRVLRCGSCGACLGTMKLPKQGDYPIYRCPSTSDCDHHVTVSAEIVERIVVDYVKQRLAGIRGTASASDTTAEAAAELERAQALLDAAYAGFDTTEPAAIAKLQELTEARNAARVVYGEAAANSKATTTAVTVGDWDDLTLEERRALIRAVIERVTVAPGRGDRIKIDPRPA